MKHAPVFITTINRYTHFKQCLESLEQCTGANETVVYVALDFPPSEKYIEGWKKIDEYLRVKENENSFMRLVVIRREHNYGIIGDNSNGADLRSNYAEKFETYIFTEDDNVFSPNFLEFMNQSLEKYQDDPDVLAVSGYSYPIDWTKRPAATVQKQNFNASSWGWGWWTSKRLEAKKYLDSGDIYNKAPEMLKTRKFKNNIFNSFYEYMCASIIPYNTLVEKQSGCLKFTDYTTRQFLTVYDKFIISPLVSKVRTMGYDGSGQYCQAITDFNGDDEWHTNFSEQKIDDNCFFEIVENAPSLLHENLRKLNDYQRRPLSRYIIAYGIAIGIRLFGLPFMRRFTAFVFKFWHRRIV